MEFLARFGLGLHCLSHGSADRSAAPRSRLVPDALAAVSPPDQLCFLWIACHRPFVAAVSGLNAYDPGTPRDRVLTVEEIETLWKWFDSDALSLDAADILKLELLTGARCGEISGLRAEEIDRQRWIWTLPAARSKNGRQRVTPIVGAAREMLEQRLSGIENGPLFVLDNGSVMTSAHIGHYLFRGLLLRRRRLARLS
jgi:integrase